MTYIPSQKTLRKYANVLVNFALGNGKGIKKGDTVYVMGTEVTKPLLTEIRKAVWKAGGHIIMDYRMNEDDRYSPNRDFYLLAQEHQLNWFPRNYYRGLVEDIDHIIAIFGKTNPKELEGIPPQKITTRNIAMKPFQDWRFEKESKGKLSWTVALYGTEGMAREAHLSIEDYWNEIIKACFLDKKDPIHEWKKVCEELARIQKTLDELEIEKVHVQGPDVDLWVTLGKNRKWLGGGGNNIPSFEIFTSPDWRGTEGWIHFNIPLYWQGNLIEGIELEFKKGKIVQARAKKNQKALQAMVSAKNADRIGEFSLTDRRMSRITKYMAETLYDENIGGEYGNTHIAIGMAYKDGIKGDTSQFKSSDWNKVGINDSAVHTDMFSTTPRTVTAYLQDGSGKVIYRDGEFLI